MSTYYKLFLVYIGIILFVIFGVYSVFSTDLFFDAQIIKSNSLSNNIYFDNKNLNNTIIDYLSKYDLENYEIISSCNIKSKYVGKQKNNYYFKIKFLDDKCKNNILFLANNKKIVKNSLFKLNFFSKEILFDFYSNKKDQELNKIRINLKKLLKSNIGKFKGSNLINIEKIKLKRLILELNYQKVFIEKIIKQRQKKYISPVKGYEISKQRNKIPNAGRPYRASYTDGIHHGWDIPAPLGTKVRALAYGKIVRIVRDFKFSDLNKIKRKNSNYDDKLINLDILRGNQVWLKTALGDVVFYSHLQNIPDNLKEGSLVDTGEILGEIGVSGVPDRHYKDFHLHFPIMKNPRENKQKYSFLDYMKWDWYFKGKSVKYILENQDNIFTK